MVIREVLPWAYWWAFVAAVLPPVGICILLFKYSVALGLIGLLCLPFVVLGSLAIMRLLLETLLTVSNLGQSVGQMLVLLSGLDSTLQEVAAPASKVANGFRAVTTKGREPKRRM